ncbi:MAG: efflux RND transporter permease subunit [Halioglobus sp.]
MTFSERLLKEPHAILAATVMALLLGWLGFKAIPANLFPDTNRPTISVVVQWPGATTKDVADEVTHALEVRLSAIDGVRRITSTSRDEVASVQVEFEYGNEINTAANAVTTELSRVRGALPNGVLEPLVFKITDAARPVMTLAVTPAQGSGLDLAQVRRLAERELRDTFLNLPGVAEAEVFGGPIRQVSVDIDRDKLLASGVDLVEVATALTASNISRPAGTVYLQGDRLILTAQSLATGPADLAAVLVPLENGDYLRVGDLGDVYWGETDPTSLYYGDSREAVAVAILRSEKGFAQPVIDSVNSQLDTVRKAFPTLDIRVADTQGRLINLTVSNMLDSLRGAVIMTVLIILLFIGNTRAALVVAVSLPISYFLSFAVLWWMGFEFNMVTLSAIIIAVGLLADDAIVVIDNIERRMRELGEEGRVAAVRGLDEIILADTSGTISTILVLVPIMFIGGFVQTVLRPLTVTLSVALLSSLIVSMTVIPLLAPLILRPRAKDPLAWLLRPFARFVLEPLKRLYIFLVSWGLQHRLTVLLMFAVLFIVCASQMRLLGRELMPLMDTGISQVRFEAQPDTDDRQMQNIIEDILVAIHGEIPDQWYISDSVVVGAEPGVKSFGAQRLLQQGEITINLVDRFQRDRSLYDINESLRQRLHEIPGLISANVSVFGATPLSSIRASVDILVKGPDPVILDVLGDEVMSRLHTVPGLTGMERSWQGISNRIELNVDPVLARLYGLSAANIAEQVAQSVGGTSGGRLRVKGEDSMPVVVRLLEAQRSDYDNLAALAVRTADGSVIPLASVASPRLVNAPTAETHQYLQPTLDILAWRRDIAITTLHDNVETALAGMTLPRGYTLSYEGEYKQISESFSRLAKSFVMGLVLLYLMLAVTFRSFLDPLAIMGSLPLAVIGAAWGLLLADKFGSMPAFMGLILLMGIVVNNGILLIDFTKVAIAEGHDTREALLKAVENRTRPILMTALSSAVGMIPLAMEWAVGIERLSPLAVVAIGGLLAGTFLTLLAVPVFYSLLASLRYRVYGK